MSLVVSYTFITFHNLLHPDMIGMLRSVVALRRGIAGLSTVEMILLGSNSDQNIRVSFDI